MATTYPRNCDKGLSAGIHRENRQFAHPLYDNEARDGRPPPKTKRHRLTKPSTTSIVQQPHLLLRRNIGRSSSTRLLLVICIAFVRVLITDPVNADEIKPGPNLLEDPVQRLLVLGVVGRRLLASELVSNVVQPKM